mmetsp:Transcript_17051/g.22202  ORF Transcript_17051/g.22202 Transcript_17051/m.22202 type:complete len:107 (+) Transcript_17051:1-321(+)
MDIKSCKVMVVVLTKAFYQSMSCLEEMGRAIEKKLQIVTVQYEKDLPKEDYQWTQATSEEEKLMRDEVMEKLMSVQHFPLTFGHIMSNDENDLDAVKDMVERKLNK